MKEKGRERMESRYQETLREMFIAEWGAAVNNNLLYISKHKEKRIVMF